MRHVSLSRRFGGSGRVYKGDRESEDLIVAGENVFTGIINMSGDIFEMNGYRQGNKVGIDAEKENEYIKQIAEMQTVIDNYFDKLVELGAIVPPKSAEQIAAEQLAIAQEQAAQQAEINQSLLKAISGLQAQIEEMKNNGNARNNNVGGGDNSGKDSAENGKKPASGKGRVERSEDVDTKAA